MALVTFRGIVASWDKSKWYSDGCRSLFLVCDVLSVSYNFLTNITYGIWPLLGSYRISSSYQIIEVKLPIGWSMSPYGTSASTPQIVLHII